MASSAKVTVYRTRFCPFCVAAARLLDTLGVVYEEVSVDGHADRRSLTSGILAGHTTVPLIVIGEEPIGGYEELVQLESSGRLEELLGTE